MNRSQPRTAKILVVLLPLLLVTLSGCLNGPGTEEETPNAGLPFDACVHPWPCADGTEWPDGLEGPFDVQDPTPLRVPGHDGVDLEAYLWLPELPDAVPAPVVLHAQPYAGQCYTGPTFCFPRGDDAGWLDNTGLRPVVEAGYGVVNLNVRGTGTSGGCFEMNGPNEAQDLRAAVEWLGRQPWSNGRVAMTGLSYMGTTPWLAAGLDPEPLKTIVPGGIVSDEYLFTYSPQGAGTVDATLFSVPYSAGVGVYPPLGAPENLPTWTGMAPQNSCPEVAEMFAAYAADPVRDDRDAAYWTERQHIMRFPDITAAVFVYQGFQDNTGHGFQEDAVWHALDEAPRRMLLGAWGHMAPSHDDLVAYPHGHEWNETLVAWFDFWLKGVGEVPHMGVDYQTSDGDWLEAAAWPPDDARNETLHLQDGALRPGAGTGTTTFTATTEPTADTPYCEPAPVIASFASSPTDAPATIAGNPFAFLQVESDRPGGIVAVDLYDLGPGARCEDGALMDGTWLTGGAADLRFHAGNLHGEDFPTGAANAVRVDLFNLAHEVPEGHRIAVVASGHGHQTRIGQPYVPTITLHGDGTSATSHIVLPLVAGTLGGEETDLEHPPRPFQPREIAE